MHLTDKKPLKQNLNNTFGYCSQVCQKEKFLSYYKIKETKSQQLKISP